MQFKQFDVDAVMVDLDGTMVDTLADFDAALNLMLADLPAPYSSQRISRATLGQLIGKGSEHLIKSVLQHVHAGLNAPDLEAVEAEQLYQQAWPDYQKHYLAVNGRHAVVYPGVVAGLSHLKSRGLKLACLTNKPTAFALPLLQAKGLADFFDFTFGGDSFERKKPDPLPLLKTCAALGSSPARTLMIGDSSNDAQAARRAGCPVLLVNYGYNHGQPIDMVDADGVCDSLQQLVASI